MPQMTIQIDELQETEILDLLDNRKSFRVNGGTVTDSRGDTVQVDYIEFRFKQEPDGRKGK